MMTFYPVSSTRAATNASNVPAGELRRALAKLRKFLGARRMKERMGPKAFADFERELHDRVMEMERNVIAAEE